MNQTTATAVAPTPATMPRRRPGAAWAELIRSDEETAWAEHTGTTHLLRGGCSSTGQRPAGSRPKKAR